jgi:predicted ester cyclase
MSIEHNKQIAQALFDEVYSQGQMDRIDDLIAPDYRSYNPLPGQPPGRAGFKYAISQVRAAFPDHQVVVEELVAEGDKVVARLRAGGTHRGEFFGLAPTGKQATWMLLIMLRIVDGRVTDNWNQWDVLGLLRQLGAWPGLWQPDASKY